MSRPNVLLITADQLRYDCIGPAGNTVVRTPNLDGLARSSVTFENAYTAATICVPARQSILTGQAPSAHGAMSVRSAIPEERDTLVKRLRAHGYETAAFGKMHFWPVYADYGFDHMELAEQDGPGWHIDDYHAGYLRGHGLIDRWDLWDQQEDFRRQAPRSYWQSYGARASELPEEHYHTTWIAERTIAWLEARTSSEPFFVWTSFIKPHHPFDPPRPYDALYDPAEVPLPPRDELWRSKPLLTELGDPRLGYFDTRAMSEDELRQVIAMYYGLITHLDLHLGRILAALDRLGLGATTTVVFTSDHGDYLGQYGLFLKHPNVPYDALARVPLIIRPAGGDPDTAGARTAALVSTMDLLPTVVAGAGIPLPDHVQGRDLTGVLDDPSAPHDEPVYLETGAYRAVRTGRHTYIYSGATGTAELYDVVDDPHQLKDLSRELPEVAERHRRMLLDWAIACSWDRYRHDRWELP